MTVFELIQKLEKITDKSKPVQFEDSELSHIFWDVESVDESLESVDLS